MIQLHPMGAQTRCAAVKFSSQGQRSRSDMSAFVVLKQLKYTTM